MPDNTINDNDEVPVITKMEDTDKSSGPKVEPSNVPNPEEMVQVKAGSLTRILERLDTQDKEIGILRQSVNQGKLSEAENAQKPKELPKVYLKVFQNKIVVGWKTEKAETFSHPSNPSVPVGEVLKSRYYFIDGSDSGIIDQVDFTRTEDHVDARVLEGLSGLLNQNQQTVRLQFERLVCSPGNTELIQSFVLPLEPYEIKKDFLNP